MKNYASKLIIVMSILVSQASLYAMDKSKKQAPVDPTDINFEFVEVDKKKPLGVSHAENTSKKSVENRPTISHDELVKLQAFFKSHGINVDAHKENIDTLRMLRDTVYISAGGVAQTQVSELTPEQETALKAYAS